LYRVFAVGMFSLLGLNLAQSRQSKDKILEQAQREYAAEKFSEAERDFREVAKQKPSDVYAHVYLGQTLFRQEKYAEAVGPFEKARELERNGAKLSPDQHRILIDQLAMSYGISGNHKKARALLEDAIQRDAAYPINYYNLACLFAEAGEKGKMLANLSLSFQHKDHILKGEQMPDPRSDSSFQKYLHDDDFIALMNELYK
jgi:predicted Zn-dependent protease